MELRKRIWITLVIGLVLILGFFFITDSITKYTGFSISEHDDDFTACLKNQDIALYVNTNDVAKTLKSLKLFDYLQDFKITNCLNNNQNCLDNEVDSFPYWIINNNRINRDINLDELSEYSGCKLFK